MRHVPQIIAASALLTILNAGLTAASPISYTEFGSYDDGTAVSVGNRTILNVFPGTSFEVIEVPKFDPALGTLLQAELVVSGAMSSRMTNHAEFVAGGVSTTATARATATLGADPVLQSLLGSPTVSMSTNFGTRTLSDDSLFNPSVSSTRHLTDTYFQQLTYTGADLSPFIAIAPWDLFSLSSGFNMVVINGSHSGFPNNSLLDFRPKAGTAPNVSPYGANPALMLLSVALLSAQLADLSVADGHGLLGYSDFHLASDAQFYMGVTYTYEPMAAEVPVPEPATVLMLGSGLAAAVATRRRRCIAPR